MEILTTRTGANIISLSSAFKYKTVIFQVAHAHCGLEPLVFAAIPTMKYNSEAFLPKDDSQ